MANKAEQRFTKAGFASTPPHWTILDRFKSLAGKGADNVNIATIQLFGHYYAATEVPQLIEYDPVTLETIGSIDLMEVIPGMILQTAHPMYDSDGTMWNVGIAAGPDKFGHASGVWRYVIYKVNKYLLTY